jgi:RNA polymerase sporulation-specific sigma factor
MTVERGALLEAAQAGNPEACEQILRENDRLIWAVVKRYTGRGTDPEDLFQLGCIGFLKAIQGFDPAYGTQFSTYAVPKIAGEIRRFLRDDGALKVSRTVKEKAVHIYNARERLLRQLGREPTISELAEQTGLEPEEIAATENATAAVTSLQAETAEGLTLESLLGDEGMEEQVLEQVSLREAVEGLPERERMVVILRYYRGLTQEKVSKIIGVSQVQVSRIEKKAMSQLRRQLEE